MRELERRLSKLETLQFPNKEARFFWIDEWNTKPQEERQSILTLKKGQTIIGVAYDFEDNLDEWLLISKDIPVDGLGPRIGFVDKNDVKITRREKISE